VKKIKSGTKELKSESFSCFFWPNFFSIILFKGMFYMMIILDWKKKIQKK
jgi:hypothetical protein